MNNKKTVLCLFLVVLLALSGLAMAESSPALSLTISDFKLTLNDIDYALGTPANELISAIEMFEGTKLEVFEADSCMFTGKDKEFYNNNIAIATYPIGSDGGDIIETIMVTGGGYVSPRGIGLGASKEDVINAYGDNYIEDYDQLMYYMGDPLTEPYIAFIIDLELNIVSTFYMMQNTGV